MKRLFAILLALVLAVSMAACTDPVEQPPASDGKTDSPTNSPADSGSKPNETDPPESGTSSNKCTYCYDISGNDRKCDTCGSWVNERGEVWTEEVPENLKATVVDYKYNYYVIEKIGDKFYVKMWPDEDAYKNGGNCYEDFVLATEHYTRNYFNGKYDEWKSVNYSTNYADVYEMFAIYVLQSLTGSTISNSVEECLDAASIGSETVAGKECTVKEYEGFFGVKYKFWLCGNMPLKKAQMDTNFETEYTVLYEILEWDTSITDFSADMPK